jgi:hypothetical protein
MIITPAEGAIEAKINGKSLAQSSRPIVQNLGPGTLYLGNSDSNLLSEGLKLEPKCVYEVPAPMVEGLVYLYIQAETTSCDVRILQVG